MTPELYTLSEAVKIISHVTEISEGLTFHRFRNHVNYGYIMEGAVEGEGTGKRRKYVRLSIIQGCILNEAAQYLDEKVLKWIAESVLANRNQIEKRIKGSDDKVWLVVQDFPNQVDFFKSVFICFGDDDALKIADFMDKHDRFVFVNVGRVLSRLTI